MHFLGLCCFSEVMVFLCCFFWWLMLFFSVNIIDILSYKMPGMDIPQFFAEASLARSLPRHIWPNAFVRMRNIECHVCAHASADRATDPLQNCVLVWRSAGRRGRCRRVEKRCDCTISCAPSGRGAATTEPATARSAASCGTAAGANGPRRLRSAGSCFSVTLSSTPSAATLPSSAELCWQTSSGPWPLAKTGICWRIFSTPPQTRPSSRYYIYVAASACVLCRIFCIAIHLRFAGRVYMVSKREGE